MYCTNDGNKLKAEYGTSVKDEITHFCPACSMVQVYYPTEKTIILFPSFSAARRYVQSKLEGARNEQSHKSEVS